MRSIVVLLCSLLANSVAAQAASYSISGQACASVPSPLTNFGVPRVGSSFDLEVLSGFRLSDVGGYTLVLTGLSNQTAGGLSLPFNTSVLSTNLLDAWCGFLYTSAEAQQLAPSVRGGPVLVRVTFNVPSNNALIGLTFHQQAVRITSTSLVSSTTRAFSQLGTGVVGL